MRLKLNNKDVVIPSSLNEMTLGQKIEFQRIHGDELALMLKSIEEDIENPDEKELELMQFQLEQMFRTISFFTGFSVESIKQSEVVDQIVSIYTNSFQLLLEEEANLTPQYDFVWKDEQWTIHVPELKHGDRMTFGEFIDSKQTIQNMVGLSKNKWECLVPLCAIYLRKEDEEYQESFLFEGSDRLKLMEDLPLDIALQVNFFLSSSVSSLAETFLSSTPQELSETVEHT